MRRIILHVFHWSVGLLSALVAFVVAAEPAKTVDAPELQKSVSLSVSGIALFDAPKTVKVLGERRYEASYPKMGIITTLPDEWPDQGWLFLSDAGEAVFLHHLPGNYINSFGTITVLDASALSAELNARPMDEAPLIMDGKQRQDAAPNHRKVQYGELHPYRLPHTSAFTSDKGISRGMAIAEVRAALGEPTSRATNGTREILEYRANHTPRPEARHFNPKYFANYAFESGVLVEFTIGFDSRTEEP